MLYTETIVPFMRHVQKYVKSRAGHRWQCSKEHAVCMLDKWGYKHTHTHTQYVIRIFYKKGYSKAPQCYITHTCLVYIKRGGIQNNRWVCKGYELVADLRDEINGDIKLLWYTGRSKHRQVLFAITKISRDILCLISLHVMKTGGGEAAVQSHAFLTSAADGAEWSVSSSGDFTRAQSSRNAHSMTSGARLYRYRRYQEWEKKSSVYDCTVEDVEYIYNTLSLLLLLLCTTVTHSRHLVVAITFP